ncbi:hypothetical protein DM02DRAFT_338884 [Periconia macrospinosa]|uniref:Zn(2)-C6 fungal-type domain-containing protein n=1 Tax=Periconia macrospinosa TaxID=97972 RepID=A0A2V1D0J8_9PLEO|nr:hypothetical protein DM02DRAFT_338884 [Periconia macrospinosa]
MSGSRPIFPKFSSTPVSTNHNVDTPGVQRTTRRKVSVACRVCQTRRTKCDGKRPQCGACIPRQSECGYTTRAGQSHLQARKQKMQELESDTSVMLDILCRLQTSSSKTASKLLQQLRSTRSGDIRKMVACITPSRNMSFTDNEPRRLSSATTLADGQHTPSLTRSQDLTGYSSIIGAPVGHNVSLKSMRAALDMFFACVGSLFYVLDQSELDRAMKNITTTPDLTFLELYNRPASLEITTRLSELAGVLAVGMLYLRTKAPEKAPSSEAATFYYTIGKHGLDSAINYSPLRAMKLCALFAFYNLSSHPSVALAYIGFGLSLAQDNGIDTDACSPDMSQELVDHKRTLQTLVHLKCWLSTSMDSVSESLSANLGLIAEKKVDEALLPLHELQHQVVKITMIRTTLPHDTCTSTLDSTVADHREDLSNYFKALPHWMSPSQLTAGGEHGMSKDLRSAVLYVHLFYTSAMMSLSRRLIAIHVPREPVGRIHILGESSQAIEEGFMAAQMAARVLDLILSEESAIDACWLCIHRFTAYTACIMIMYCTVQKALTGVDASQWSGDIELMSRCLRILSCCAQKDQLLTRLSTFATILQSHKQHRATTTLTKIPPLGDILFTVYSGTTELHILAKDLLGLMHQIPNLLS